MTTEPPATLAVGEQYFPGMIVPSSNDLWLYQVNDPETREIVRLMASATVIDLSGPYQRVLDAGGIALLGQTPPNRSNGWGMYVGYDGVVGPDPVNQVPVGREWLKACATFANHIAAFADHWHMLREPGFYETGHSYTHTDESNIRNRVTLWWGIGVNGEAFRQVEEWMALSPIIDPTLSADLNWKVVQVDLADIMQKVCDNCLGFNILRRFNRRCQPLNWLTLLSSGMVALPDFAEEEWGPRSVIRNFTRLPSSEKRDIWNELAQLNDKALEYYDEKIAVNVSHAP